MLRFVLFLLLIAFAASSTADAFASPRFRVLVFSKTAGYRHESIETGIEALRKLGAEHDFAVDATEDASVFTPDGLKAYDVVVFLSTTGNILDASQQEAFEGFIRRGGGFVGIHAAADTEYDWPFYGRLVGAYFKNHPHQQDADILVQDREHPSTRHLPERWRRFDEWYNYGSNPRENVTVLAVLDESSYRGGNMGGDHPIIWAHTYEGGRAWYTGLGHTHESYAEPAFLQHVLGGIEWAAGQAADPGDAQP